MEVLKNTTKPLNFVDKVMYRILAQTEGIHVSADLMGDNDFEKAKQIALEKVIIAPEYYLHFVLQEIGTANGWKYGHINFCPRCGYNIHKAMGDSKTIVNNAEDFECPECEAYVSVHIISTPEQSMKQCGVCGKDKDEDDIIKNAEDNDICVDCDALADHAAIRGLE